MAKKAVQPEKRVNKKEAQRSLDKDDMQTLEAKANQPENYKDTKLFEDLPISEKTKRGLKQSNFKMMTEIQKKGIPLALAKKDVLGAAKTGSGKTLSFLIPILEILFRQQWNSADGLGALVISPTRELAVQIFEVLKKIGKFHSFSAGLIIGGKEFKVEQERISRMNILVSTPGRLLQHMDQSVGFDCDNLQCLVLDEADRIMDMGFQNTMNAIIENLPNHRQTLMFSATQTRSVKDLARLSLKDPEYVAVHERAEHSTPKSLSQHYVTAELPQKLDILYSFIKSHLKTKMIVFISSCKQTRFVYESFCKLQPGIPIMHLHGKQKQTKRVDIFRKFTATQHALLLCTDIAARGLDFPAVDWVLQLDCPEDADTYIHRVGRTARFDAEGHALMILVPSEVEGMTEELKKKRVPIEEIKIRTSKQQTIQKQLQSFCFQDPEIKYLAQRAFVAYMRSIYLQKNKKVFDVNALPAEEFAHSLGLAGAPKIKFVKKSEKKMGAPEPQEEEEEESEEEEEEEEEEKTIEQKTKYDRMFKRKNQDILSEHYSKLVDYEGDKIHVDDQDDDDEEFMTITRKDHALESDEEDIADAETENISKRKQKMTKKDRIKTMPRGEKLIFDEDGEAHALYELVSEQDFKNDGAVKDQIKAFIDEKGELMKTADTEDKELVKQKKLEKKIKRKERERAALREEEEGSDENMEDVSSEEESEDEEEESKKRSWDEESEDESEEEHVNKKRIIDVEEPETLEDQEALALKLLGL